MRGVVLAAAAVFCGGCSNNAVLELTLELPTVSVDCDDANPVDCTFMQFEARDSAEFPQFEQNWGTREDPPPFLLRVNMLPDQVSVVSSNASESDLNIRLAFCDSPACPNVPRGEAWFVVEHPFYPGERTSVTLTVPDLPVGTPAAPTIIPRCQVRGCLDPPLPPFCVDDSPNAAHFCER